MSRWLSIPAALAGGVVSLAMAAAVWWSSCATPGHPRTDTVRSEMRTLADCVELYRVDNGRYPTSEEGLQLVEAAGKCRANLHDPWGHPYRYRLIEAKPARFEISSSGQEGPRSGPEPQEIVMVSGDES